MKWTLLVVALMCLGLASMSEAATVELTSNANTEPDLAGYRLYRAPGTCAASGPFVAVLTVPPTTDGALVRYRDVNVPNGTFCYYATAFDVAGNESLPSNRVQTTVDAIAPAPPGNLRLIPSEAESDAGEIEPVPE
jgi:hypothetical protein